MYFLGKITGRDPLFDIENGLMKVLPQMTAETLKSNLVRCGGEMQSEGKSWRVIGADIVRRSQKMMKQQNSGQQP
jgi:hypothetical protein